MGWNSQEEKAEVHLSMALLRNTTLLPLLWTNDWFFYISVLDSFFLKLLIFQVPYQFSKAISSKSGLGFLTETEKSAEKEV